MMKRIIACLIILFCYTSVLGQAGVVKRTGVILDTLTTPELDALDSRHKVRGSFYYDRTKKNHVTWDPDAGDWVDVGGAADGLGTARDVGPFTVVDADNATLDANAVATANIQDDAVTAAKIPTGAVGSDEIANSGVTSVDILDGAVDTDDLADAAVTGAKIQNSTITANKLAGFGGVSPLVIDVIGNESPAPVGEMLEVANDTDFRWVTKDQVATDGLDDATLVDIGTPASDDQVLIKDTSNSGTLRYVDWADVGGGGGGASDPIVIFGDGVTDMTTAINTALSTYNTAYLIGDVITTSAITLGDNQRLEGPGTLTNNTTDVLVIDGTNTHIELASISSTAGHILTFTDNTFNFSVRNTKLSALNTGKSQVYVRGAVGVYDMVIEHCYFETGPNHTVPMVDVVVTAENFNENRFINNTFQTNGSPTAEVIHIETTAAAFWLSGNEVSGNLFEIPTAGAIHVYSVAGMKMHNNTVYDLPTSGAATGDMIYIDNTTGGLNSAGVTISDYHRVAGDLTTNTVYDINNQGAYAGSISVYDAVGLASSQLLFNGLTGHIVQGGYYISNDGGGSGFPTKSELDTFAELDALVADQTLTYINASEFGSTVDNRIPIFRGNDGGIEGDGRLTWNNGSVKVGTGAFNMDFGSNNISFNGTGNEGFIDQTGLRGIIFRTENSGGTFENTLTVNGGADDNSVDVLHGLNVGADLDVTGELTPGSISMGGILNMGGFNLTNLDVLSIGSGLDGDLSIPANGSFTIGANSGVTVAMTVDGASGTVDFPNAAPTVVADPYDPTDWNDNDAVADKGSIRDEMEKKLNSDITGEPSGAYVLDNIVGITRADLAAGTPVSGTTYVVEDPIPAEVVTTATIAMEGWKMYDDQTADAGTITLSDCDPGETLTVYINRASAPTLAGTGLTFNQLPNTTAFAAATEMMIVFEVAYDGTTIDYFYVER